MKVLFRCASAMVLSAALLTGCANSPAGPSSTAPGSSATASAAPAATGAPSSSPTSSSTASPTTAAPSTAEPSAVIPTECSDLIASTPFTATFGAWPLNNPAVVGTPGSSYSYPAGSIVPTPAPAGATLAETLYAATQLRCVWRDPSADITSMTIEIATVDPADASEYLASLPAAGYTCAATSGTGEACQLTTKDQKYPVDVGSTAFLRGDTYIHISQANVSTPGLVDSLTSTLWG